MTRDRDRRRCREQLERLADARLPSDEARLEAVAALQRAVGFEQWCWPLTDPGTGIATSGIGEFAFAPSLPRLAALEQHGDVTSKPLLFTGSRASVALSVATGGDLSRSPRWRECLQPYGIGDELMTACRDRHGWWGSVELMRADTDDSFDEDDVRFLDELAGLLGQLLRCSAVPAASSPTSEPRPPATLILGRDLETLSWTPSLRDWLATLPAAPGTLPPAIYEIVARALEGTGGPPNHVRIRTTDGRWTVIEGGVLDGAQCGDVAVTVREATASEVFDVLARRHGLTERERELSALVVAGLPTKALARALSISPYTVQDHLKAVFAKTGARTRGELVSELTGRA